VPQVPRLTCFRTLYSTAMQRTCAHRRAPCIDSVHVVHSRITSTLASTALCLAISDSELLRRRTVYYEVFKSLNQNGPLRGAVFWEWPLDGTDVAFTGGRAVSINDTTWQ